MKRSKLANDTETVAQMLLGAYLCRDGQRHRIIETEAYLGPHDRACHSAKGRTARTETMYAPPGTAYVYMIYGMYFCLNVVTEPGAAVLIRALEGEGMNGPGKLCRALGIDKRHNGIDLLKCDELWLEDGQASERIVRSARIGVDYAGPWAKRKLRFHLRGTFHSRA